MKRAIFLFLTICCVVLAMATNRALLIGIGEYKEGTNWTEINGDSDVELLRPLLEKQGFIVHSLTNDKATKKEIVKALDKLIDDCEAGDKVYFHFSGHGQPIEDINEDETTPFDQTMVPFDAGRVYIKNIYEGENHFVDDEYSYYLNALRKKLGDSGQLFIVIDACHSQGIERGEITDSIDVELAFRGTDDVFRFKDKQNLPPKTKPSAFLDGASTIIVSACGKEERNYEYKTPSGKMYGSLSYCISRLLQNDSDFERWRIYFENERYRERRIFPQSQHPTIKVYQ